MTWWGWIKDFLWGVEPAPRIGARSVIGPEKVAKFSVAVLFALIGSVGVSMLAAAPVVSELAPDGQAKKDYDALAVALTAQSNSIAAQANYLTFATIILAVLALLFALGWAAFFRSLVERTAKEVVRGWVDREALPFIADALAKLTPDQKDGGNSHNVALSQPQQESELGGENPATGEP